MTLGTFLSAGTGLAQNPVTSGPISKGRDARLITPEAVLSLREPRELQISPDGKQVAFRVREPADPKLSRSPRKTNIWIVPTEQLVGRERRERVSQLNWCSQGCFDSPR